MFRTVSFHWPYKGYPILICLLAPSVFGCNREFARPRHPLPLTFGLLGPTDLPPSSRHRRDRYDKRGIRQSQRTQTTGSGKTRDVSASDRPTRTDHRDLLECAKRQIGRTFAVKKNRATFAFFRACLGKKHTQKLMDKMPRAHLHHHPRPGDVIVFDDAYDRNDNRLLDDPRSGLGIVIEIRKARVFFVYLSGQRARRGILHLRQPSSRWSSDPHHPQNSYVRIKHPADPPKTAYLAGQLLAGFHRPHW